MQSGIRRLAAEAKIAVGTVYNYFENKQDVLLGDDRGILERRGWRICPQP